MGDSDYIKIGLMALFLVTSAFFSGTETAFIALQRVRLIHMVNTGVPGAQRVFRMAQHPERFLSTVLLGNNVVNTAAAALGTAIVMSLIDSTITALVVSTVGVSVLVLIFSEVLPKSIAASHAEKVAFITIRPLLFLEWLFFPLTKALSIFSSLAARFIGEARSTTNITEQEIRSLINAGMETGAVDRSEAEMLEKVFHFGDRQVSEIMTPRPEIIWVEQGTTLEQLLSIYSEHYHTRFPVFADSIDNVLGLLSMKDVLKATADTQMLSTQVVTNLLRPAHFVPETKTVRSLFTELREKGQSMAILIDEFGGVAGLATMKQLLMVIVGPVGEEGQPLGQPLVRIGHEIYLLDGGLGIYEINHQLDIGIPEGSYQSVAGYILDQMGRIPSKGDYLDCGTWRITVVEMTGLKVSRVEVKPTFRLTGTQSK
ncbi:HlyC/CorC family transporter [SAR202 cluster bacterium AD-804-J14_MRT_500m]|nr:HlyC/CorC family transporter [SAR202 cluster bacterium AD-804-J14_MRT_500m]